jgi:hypothetical protein
MHDIYHQAEEVARNINQPPKGSAHLKSVAQDSESTGNRRDSVTYLLNLVGIRSFPTQSDSEVPVLRSRFFWLV